MVINTPFGLYEFQRLPYGVASAPAVFQRLVEQVILGIPNCINYLDDIVITGQTIEEHLNVLEQLFERLKENGLQCKLSKCKFLDTQVEYLGHIINAEGITPSESSVEAIRNLPRPANLKEVQAFIGKCNYYNRFIPNLSQIAAPLNELRKKDVRFMWKSEQERAFQLIKQKIIAATRLVHFREDYPIVLATDASSHGIGAVISHIYPDGHEKPIAFASKTLDIHQKKYSQIEKEALSIIFGCTKFNQYLYGRKFLLWTDHKPLVALFHPNKQLPTMTANRLQRWAIKLMAYHYEIKYKPTDKHQNADALSRLPSGPDLKFDEEEETCMESHIMFQEELENFPLDSSLIAKYTLSDPVLSKVVQYVTDGWPEINHTTEIKPFEVRKNAISVFNGVLLLQNDTIRVIIPEQLKSRVLKMLHEGHWGMVKTKQIARRHCWWHKIDQDIERLIRTCQPCQEISPEAKREFSSWPNAMGPWQRIHIDFAGPFMNSMWLLCTDSYSKYPYVMKMGDITATSTVRSLQAIFTIEGLPDTIVSDNGTSFTSNEFQTFCKENGIQHLTIAPFHPASNGEVERCVRTFKTSLKKLKLDGESTDHALLKFLSTYRFSPGTTGKSPAELIHGRQPKTILSLMLPRPPNETHLVKDVKHKFSEGNAVYIRNYSRGGKWLEGEILKTLGKMMYLVRTTWGNLRRHQNQMRARSLPCPYQQAEALLSPAKASMNDQNFKNVCRSSILKTPLTSASELVDYQTETAANKRLSPMGSGELPRRSERVSKPVVRFGHCPVRK